MNDIVGIDEAGRGPLAGPVAVGVVIVYGTQSTVLRKISQIFFKGIKDSKKLSPQGREVWFVRALEARQAGWLDFAVALVSERIIDRHGISSAIRTGIQKCLVTLDISVDSQIYLDGGLKAPARFQHQLTIIKGDEKIPVIALASIMAKVTRDRKMVRLAKKFPEFDFHLHKGYGTRGHQEALRRLGPTTIHRHSFLTHFIK
jgi:ribonuclease HII